MTPSARCDTYTSHSLVCKAVRPCGNSPLCSVERFGWAAAAIPARVGPGATRRRVGMGRPVIGLTTYAESTRFGTNDTFSAVLPLAYVHAVHQSGGRAVLITPDDPDVDILDRIDGIVFSGG